VRNQTVADLGIPVQNPQGPSPWYVCITSLALPFSQAEKAQAEIYSVLNYSHLEIPLCPRKLSGCKIRLWHHANSASTVLTVHSFSGL